ncbi:MAG: hypothetical protein IKZ13_09010 [Akkermansia sp.]|nr:hypothetical protein [Akkermansia sp.]
MKLHLPFALLATMVSAVAYADNSGVSFNTTEGGNANVTISADAGDLSDYYMYGTLYGNPCAPGIIGAASVCDQDGNAPIEKFQSATITMNGGTNLGTLSGYGVQGNAVAGDTTINMNGGSTKLIVGGTAYSSSANRPSTQYGTTPEGGHVTNFTYKSNYGNESDPNAPKQNININVTGGTVGQIRGTHSGHSQVHLYTADGYIKKVHAGGEEAIAKFMESNPVAVSGNVNISVTGGEITSTYADKDETAAIQGGGGSGYSVDGTVGITVGGDAKITGNIIAGSSNSYTFVGGTKIDIQGGEITGNIYGGGDNSAPKITGGLAATVKGDTNVSISGGTITGNVYGAGMSDVVKGNTNVTVSGGTITGTVYGGGTDGSVVEGTKSLTVTTGYTGALSIADFDAVTIENGTKIELESVGSQLALNDVAFTAYSNQGTEGAIMTLGNGITIDSLEFVVVITNEDLVYGNTFTLNLLELIDGTNPTESMSILDLGVATADESGLDYTLTFVDENGRELGLKDSDYNMTVTTNGNTTSYQVSVTIPEPTTATLSLLALAGLAARRRRK